MKRDPRKDWKWLAIVVLTVAIVALAVNAYMLRTREVVSERQDKNAAVQGQQQAAVEGQSLADEVLQACRAGGKDAKALSAAGLCGKASTTKENIDQTVKDTPTSTSTTTIVRRETLPRGTLLSAIRAALTSTCGADGCRDGRDSKVPGPESTVPGPASTIPGPTGATGGTGAKGDTGSKGDTGDPGAKGDTGASGADGRGIASLVCSSSFGPITFTLTLTDGTTQEFSCGSLPVEPDPVETAPAE